MLSRISQLGARLLRENRAAGSLASSTTSYYRGQLSRRFVPTKNILFSTATTSSDRDDSSQSKEKISVTFVNKDGTEQTISVPVGMSMLEAAHENDIELEGACEGSLACSTCHVIVMDVNYYNKLEDPTDEENDMLDLAFGLTETSRLGCQVIAKPELDGMRLALPAATRNFAVDGFVPKPH
uniref:2Fe-2S ferredoxin-type domain-containing protein n=2 Tax=Oryza glaberrima TaxID=4538 RepID=I1Q7G8_ORYGL